MFLTNSVLVALCVPEADGYAEERLQRLSEQCVTCDGPGDWVEFPPGHGDWIRILQANGFSVEALHELYAPTGTKTHEYYEIVTS